MKQSNSTPIISVVIPLFNKEREVQRTIQSVLNQTIADFEVIIVNDGSTDKGPEVVRSISDPRIRIIDQINAGVSAARNRGIREAQADLIAFLDADDEWEPDFLETLLMLKRDFPECSVFATSYCLVNQDGVKRPAVIRGLPNDFRKGILKDYFIIAAKSDPPLCSSDIAVKKTAISSVGGFPEGIVSGEDLLTWAKLAVKYDIAYSITPKAFHWEPVEISDRPMRVFNVPDIVGKELQILLSSLNGTKIRGLKGYIALWHRMRASFYLRIGQRANAIKEIQKAVSFSGFNLKLLFYSVLLLLPKKLTNALFKFKKHMNALA